MYHVPAVTGDAGAKMRDMTDVPPIRTARFELVSMSLPFMQRARATTISDGRRSDDRRDGPADMPDDLEHFLEYRIADLTGRPDHRSRGSAAAIVLDDEPASAGHRLGRVPRPPDEDGRVEIGYRVEPEHRRQGVATEVARRCSTGPTGSTASRGSAPRPRPDNVALAGRSSPASASVEVGVQMDENDGLELVFELDGWAATS